jgi:uncharacterized protein (DUF1800 family)
MSIYVNIFIKLEKCLLTICDYRYNIFDILRGFSAWQQMPAAIHISPVFSTFLNKSNNFQHGSKNGSNRKNRRGVAGVYAYTGARI